MRPPARWPLHPPPGPLESLSSWVDRLARLYDLPVNQLLGPNLGVVAQLPAVIDDDPPAEVLTALAERTGVELGRVRATTLAGWVPWLFDCLPVTASESETVFRHYVRGGSVLLRAHTHSGPRPRRNWRGPWIANGKFTRRACPMCGVTGPQARRSWLWELPLTLGCPQHRCRLEPLDRVTMAELKGEPLQPVPITEPLATLESYTYRALADGRVNLPGRGVHAGVWFRLLRCLLDELSLAATPLSARPRRVLEQVWEATGLPVRAGLSVWQPYERLPWEIQEQLLTAAAVALHLVAERRIFGEGMFASALVEERHTPVYGGDDPRIRKAEDMNSITALAQKVLRQARTDENTARQMFALLTAFDPTPANYAKQRKHLISEVGVPPEFLYLLPLPGPERCYTPGVAVALLAAEGYDRDEVRLAVDEYLDEIPLRDPDSLEPVDVHEYRLTTEDIHQLRARLRL
ncbi:TniQ family protein [Nocardia sp. NBC_00881]|uniref:TniQ family protein n=1 Tax=Nocardia sp. NBC_00881 TaxID=2975995 RepID=UPI00386ABDE7|nr:TniQ family protein [Nocardia sp. NBC_00881]